MNRPEIVHERRRAGWLIGPRRDPKLAELDDQGILTDEDFAAKKAQILGP